MSVALKLSEDSKMKNAFLKNTTFQMELISFWFVSKKNIKIYRELRILSFLWSYKDESD